MIEEVVVDTNVPRTANGDAPQANRACVLRCVDELERIQRECRLVLDNRRAKSMMVIGLSLTWQLIANGCIPDIFMNV